MVGQGPVGVCVARRRILHRAHDGVLVDRSRLRTPRIGSSRVELVAPELVSGHRQDVPRTDGSQCSVGTSVWMVHVLRATVTDGRLTNVAADKHFSVARSARNC
jgi:hypothetical protein